MNLEDVAIGQRVAIAENIADEVRWTYYVRVDGTPRWFQNWLPVRRLRTVQGRKGQNPRYDSGPYDCLSEMSGKVRVVDATNDLHGHVEQMIVPEMVEVFTGAEDENATTKPYCRIFRDTIGDRWIIASDQTGTQLEAVMKNLNDFK